MVQAFYDFFSNPGSEAYADKFRAATDANWESVGNYSGKNKTREQLIVQLAGFAKLIPDLNWEVVEVIEQGNRVVVRGRATGTYHRRWKNYTYSSYRRLGRGIEPVEDPIVTSEKLVALSKSSKPF